MTLEDHIPGDEDPLCGNRVSDLFRCALEATAPASGAPAWQPPTPAHLAELLPQYQIVSLIGRGGMGAVYRGVQTSLNRPVAIKLLPSELAANEEFIMRFQREAQTLARLQHPGIVAVHDFGQTDEGHLYFIMEFVDGTDLQHIIHGPGLGPEQALELTLQVCKALHYAHRQGVIHRDIKPANVLVTQDGHAKLADFGLARPLTTVPGSATAASLVMGTPDYMAPEQWTGKADHRADIYSLGVMLYEMLTGHRPQGVFDLPSQCVSVDARLDEVVVKAMRQEPDRRYQQVSELGQAVESIRATEPPRPAAAPAVMPAMPTPRRQAPGTEERLGGRGVFAVAAVVCVLAALAYVAWPRQDIAVEAGSVASLYATPQPPSVAKPKQEPKVARQPVEEPEAPPVSVSSQSEVVAANDEAEPRAAPAGQGTASSPPPATPALAALSVSMPPPPPVLITLFSKEAQNLTSWVLAPLEETLPPDIRQNLTFLREDLIDEGKTKPAASLDAYRAAYYFCEGLIAALNERDKARSAAGYRAAQSAASQVNTNQALEARRNYMMSWPQHAREGAARAELVRESASRTALASETQKLAWAGRAEKLRQGLDQQYRQFRAALR